MLGLGFYVTNSDRRVRVGDRVIFSNHIPVLYEPGRLVPMWQHSGTLLDGRQCRNILIT